MTSKNKNLGNLTFGLDIGIASVGWAVLNEHRIVDLGVRCFDKAETADKGEPLNLARRSARLLRRRLRRRAWRLTKLARLLKREGLIADTDILKQQPTKGFMTPNLWQLRVDGLDRKLEPEEWARVLYHLCKHRGFHWMSKAEEKKADDDKEGGAVKQGLAGTKRLMIEKSYRTAAEMAIGEFPDAQRNKRGDYSKALSRLLLADELTVLFQHQRELGNSYATAELEARILDRKTGLFWTQKPALSGNDLLKMLGKCTFEKTEYRAPKASFSAERHVWLTRLNNLRIVVDGKTRPLTDAERHFALLLPYQQATDFSYKQLGNALVKEGFLQKDGFRFAGLSYPSDKQREEEKAKNPEDEKLIKLPGWQALRKAFKEVGLDDEWQKISVAAFDGHPQLLDDIACVLSVYKEDEEVERELNKLDLPNKAKVVEVLLTTRFDKFSNLSLKTLYNILPHMAAGLRYDEACIKAGYHHSQLHQVGTGEHKYLPPFYSGREKDGRLKFNEDLDIPRNPVVLRALNQARKVVNALIKTYGSPHEVHIEMARDLSRPFDERRDIKKAQDEFRDRNEKDRAAFNAEYNASGRLKGRDFEKWQLYREQHGKCPYCGDPLEIDRLFEMKYVEVDHALPYSRSFDDSKNNRVAVHDRCNQDKGNMTPFEYLGGKDDSEHWRLFVAYVESNKTYRQAKRSRLLKRDFGEEEAKSFSDRNLNDTRHICRFFKNYVERYLKLADDSDVKRCTVVSGQLTSFLRTRWGLIKVRADSDRHHALDAAVVAACSHGMVKRLSDYSRRKELEQVRAGFIDMKTGEIVNPAMLEQLEQHFPAPWVHFRQELLARLNEDDHVALRGEMAGFGTYAQEELKELRSLFVSRAISRRGGGEIHKAKIFAIAEGHTKKSFEKVPISNLTLAKLEKMVGKNDGRNQALYEALRTRLAAAGDDPKKAFGPDQPKLTKPSKEGKTSPEIRSIRIEVTQNSGLLVRGGIADLGEMMFIDIFEQETGGHFVVPRYKGDVSKMRNPISAPDGSLFCFSLVKNDLVEIELGGEKVRGYFVMYESDGRMTLRAHDQPQPDKKFFRKSIANAKSIKKFNVDILGNLYPSPPEKRRDLA